MTTATRQADCANCPALGAVLCPARGKAPEALGRPPRQLLINPENGPIYLFGGRRHVGLLQSGLVMRVAQGQRGENRALHLVFPGELTGEPFCNDRPKVIQALAPSRICTFDLEAVEHSADSDSGLSDALLRATSASLERLQRSIWIRALLSTLEKVAALLVLVAEHQQEQHATRGPLIVSLAWPRRLMAELIGTSAESISRATHELQRRGLITIRDAGTFELHDLDALRDLAELEASPGVDRHQCRDSRKRA